MNIIYEHFACIDVKSEHIWIETENIARTALVKISFHVFCVNSDICNDDGDDFNLSF